MSILRHRWVAGGIAVLLVVVTSCSEHTVGPARTFDDFERKSRTTAQVALSAVETVRLVAQTATSGDAFGPYTSVSISEQEDTLASARGDFASIQPPDDDSTQLRDQLNGILAAATDHLAAVRIAARRGELTALERIAEPLADDSAALQQFLDSIS